MSKSLERSHSNRAFLDAIKTGDIPMLELLLQKELVDINEVDGFGNRWLHQAIAQRASIIVLKWFIDKGADINARNKFGNTPFLLAINDYLDLETLEFLLGFGANINDVDNGGNGPLHKALIFFREPEMVEFLIKHSANIDAKNNESETPSHMVARFLNSEPLERKAYKNLKVLVKNGADVKSKIPGQSQSILDILSQNPENASIFQEIQNLAQDFDNLCNLFERDNEAFCKNPSLSFQTKWYVYQKSFKPENLSLYDFEKFLDQVKNNDIPFGDDKVKEKLDIQVGGDDSTLPDVPYDDVQVTTIGETDQSIELASYNNR